MTQAAFHLNAAASPAKPPFLAVGRAPTGAGPKWGSAALSQPAPREGDPIGTVPSALRGRPRFSSQAGALSGGMIEPDTVTKWESLEQGRATQRSAGGLHIPMNLLGPTLAAALLHLCLVSRKSLSPDIDYKGLPGLLCSSFVAMGETLCSEHPSAHNVLV